MAQFPINIQSFILEDGATPLTYWRCDYLSGAWTPAIKVFDSGNPAVDFYNFSAGATADGTDLGMCIADAGGDPNVSTLESIGDGIPQPVYDASAGNTLTTPAQDHPTGQWKYKGNWYEVVTELSVPNVHVRKSTDNRATWNELDAAHAPSGSVPIDFTTVTRASAIRRTLSVPNKIDLFCTNIIGGTTTRFFLYTFDLDSEMWTGPYGIQDIVDVPDGNLLAGQNSNETFWNFSDGVVRFANGDIAGFVTGSSTGQNYYAIFNGTVWGTLIAFGGANVDTLAQVIVDPSLGETMHLWTQIGGPHTTQFNYFTATHAGTVTGPLFTTPIIGFGGGGMGHAVGMSGILWVPITDNNDAFNSVWIGAEGTGSFAKSPLPIPPPDIGVTPSAGSDMLDWLAPVGGHKSLPQFIKGGVNRTTG